MYAINYHYTYMYHESILSPNIPLMARTQYHCSCCHHIKYPNLVDKMGYLICDDCTIIWLQLTVLLKYYLSDNQIDLN
jgi:hypothetical protein